MAAEEFLNNCHQKYFIFSKSSYIIFFRRQSLIRKKNPIQFTQCIFPNPKSIFCPIQHRNIGTAFRHATLCPLSPPPPAFSTHSRLYTVTIDVCIHSYCYLLNLWPRPFKVCWSSAIKLVRMKTECRIYQSNTIMICENIFYCMNT